MMQHPADDGVSEASSMTLEMGPPHVLSEEQRKQVRVWAVTLGWSAEAITHEELNIEAMSEAQREVHMVMQSVRCEVHVKRRATEDDRIWAARCGVQAMRTMAQRPTLRVALTEEERGQFGGCAAALGWNAYEAVAEAAIIEGMHAFERRMRLQVLAELADLRFERWVRRYAERQKRRKKLARQAEKRMRRHQQLHDASGTSLRSSDELVEISDEEGEDEEHLEDEKSMRLTEYVPSEAERRRWNKADEAMRAVRLRGIIKEVLRRSAAET